MNLLEHEGMLCLVAPRGETQWVKNARASGEVTLVRKASRTRYRLRELPEVERAPVLKAYLTRYESQVARFFSLRAGASLAEFAAVAAQHPVFVLSASSRELWSRATEDHPVLLSGRACSHRSSRPQSAHD